MSRLIHITAVAMFGLFAVPVSAAMPAGSMDDHKMAEGDHMMANGDKMAAKPMSRADKKMMARCQKMKPEMAAKNAKCAKPMMHEDHKM
jgi:uncharacterized membrane protein (DUF106 family)